MDVLGGVQVGERVVLLGKYITYLFRGYIGVCIYIYIQKEGSWMSWDQRLGSVGDDCHPNSSPIYT